jgi:hypothetical protein
MVNDGAFACRDPEGKSAFYFAENFECGARKRRRSQSMARLHAWIVSSAVNSISVRVFATVAKHFKQIES